MTRREFIENRRRVRRLKRIGFLALLVLIVGACGKATLSRAPEDVQEPTTDEALPEALTTQTKEVTKAGVVKPVKTALYTEGTHYLENGDGKFDVLLTSTALDLTQYEDQVVELVGILRPVQGDPTMQILEVSGLASVSNKINSDAIDAVKKLADPSYGFDDSDTYTVVDSSASAGTAVVQVVHGDKTYHVKLVRKPDPVTGEWDIYEVAEGAYIRPTSVPETTPEDEQPVPETGEPVGAGDMSTVVELKDGFAKYTDQYAGFSLQYPKGWFYWVVGESQTAENKPISSRVLFSDKTVEYENVLTGIDIAPYGFDQTLKEYYTDFTKEEHITVRGKDATRRTYSTGHVRVFVPRESGTTFIISAIPRDGGLRTDILKDMLETLELHMP